MPLIIIDALSVPSGAVNEDCVGGEAALAWVIDAATDVIEEPLVGTASDAAWFAVALDAALCRHARNPPAKLVRLLGRGSLGAMDRSGIVSSDKPAADG